MITRTRSSEREKERLKTGNRSATITVSAATTTTAASSDTLLLPPPPWVPPAAAMGTPHQSLQPPLCPWAMS
ncbi:hypothetical protein JOQ06_020003 [Pogonophryne albipinna]|uniref:Uncharacterized protein n=1 Tax=Pogonophryne albipinna TaxID=1090488 RepID=A0AAD6FWI2_9TELE|nr:hypothetical protein JOQ06_020003 [Pogonophryne albipinna]